IWRQSNCGTSFMRTTSRRPKASSSASGDLSLMTSRMTSLMRSRQFWRARMARARAKRSTDANLQRWREDPVLYFRERFGIELWEKQVEIAYSVRDNRKTHCRSGHKTGKTLLAGGLILWFLECFPRSKVVTTSSTWSDVHTKLWGAVRHLYNTNG